MTTLPPRTPAAPATPSRLCDAASRLHGAASLLLPLLLLLALAAVPALRGTPSAGHTGAAARTGGPASLVPARHRGETAGQVQRAGTRERRDGASTGAARGAGGGAGAPLVRPPTELTKQLTQPPTQRLGLPAPAADLLAGTAVVPAPGAVLAVAGGPAAHLLGVTAGLPRRRGPPARGTTPAPAVHVHPRPA